ncbi:MAG: anthranilate synthase component, partial [Chloroflexota bacterium]|nr:anthranilate synthase component [Chloroflexota bacterium]
LDTAITIRSAVLKDGQAHVHTGAGIVAGSVPESEFEETEHKAAALRRAIEMAAGVPETPRAGAGSIDDDADLEADVTQPQPASTTTGAGT